MFGALFASFDTGSSSAFSSSDAEHVAPWERHGGFLLYLLLVLYICLSFEILISLFFSPSFQHLVSSSLHLCKNDDERQQMTSSSRR